MPPSLSSFPSSAGSLQTAPPVADAALHPDTSQSAGASLARSAAACHESGESQALVGLQSYASDSDSNSSAFGDAGPRAKTEGLGPFF